MSMKIDLEKLEKSKFKLKNPTSNDTELTFKYITNDGFISILDHANYQGTEIHYKDVLRLAEHIKKFGE